MGAAAGASKRLYIKLERELDKIQRQPETESEPDFESTREGAPRLSRTSSASETPHLCRRGSLKCIVGENERPVLSCQLNLRVAIGYCSGRSTIVSGLFL
ncbi:hypothetical protein R1flu_006117 [Riccia fluitans]|uniref:Uncharacterized protein n=1 Tax=Riccia fluitans TaxID=41844 RepID=A0ABD1YV49_9MARC